MVPHRKDVFPSDKFYQYSLNQESFEFPEYLGHFGEQNSVQAKRSSGLAFENLFSQFPMVIRLFSGRSPVLSEQAPIYLPTRECWYLANLSKSENNFPLADDFLPSNRPRFPDHQIEAYS